MPVVISDEFLRQVGLSEREMLIEIACRLFDAEKLALWDLPPTVTLMEL